MNIGSSGGEEVEREQKKQEELSISTIGVKGSRGDFFNSFC